MTQVMHGVFHAHSMRHQADTATAATVEGDAHAEALAQVQAEGLVGRAAENRYIALVGKTSTVEDDAQADDDKIILSAEVEQALSDVVAAEVAGLPPGEREAAFIERYSAKADRIRKAVRS